MKHAYAPRERLGPVLDLTPLTPNPAALRRGLSADGERAPMQSDSPRKAFFDL